MRIKGSDLKRIIKEEISRMNEGIDAERSPLYSRAMRAVNRMNLRPFDRERPRDYLMGMIMGTISYAIPDASPEEIREIAEEITNEVALDPKIIKYTVSEDNYEEKALARAKEEYPHLNYYLKGTEYSRFTSQRNPTVTAVLELEVPADIDQDLIGLDR